MVEISKLQPRGTQQNRLQLKGILLKRKKMEKNNNNSTRDALSLRDRSNTTTTNTTSSSSSDFVLQWGNRKRLRCMKVQQQQAKDKESVTVSGTPPVGQPRVDRRIVRSSGYQSRETVSGANAVSNGHGYINLRQRSSSPAHRVLRNSESSIAMKGQTNGGRGGVQLHDKRGSHHNGKNNNNNNHNHINNHGGVGGGCGGGGGGSASSETAHDSKKGGVSAGNDGVPMVWPPKFVIGLTNKEKEEDFLAIKGSKLPQRPKKRAKFIQRTINSVIPGGWLCDLTLERYEVREKKITKKRPRGLKAMGSMESESE